MGENQKRLEAFHCHHLFIVSEVGMSKLDTNMILKKVITKIPSKASLTNPWVNEHMIGWKSNTFANRKHNDTSSSWISYSLREDIFNEAPGTVSLKCGVKWKLAKIQTLLWGDTEGGLSDLNFEATSTKKKPAQFFGCRLYITVLFWLHGKWLEMAEKAFGVELLLLVAQNSMCHIL